MCVVCWHYLSMSVVLASMAPSFSWTRSRSEASLSLSSSLLHKGHEDRTQAVCETAICTYTWHFDYQGHVR